ncbi:tetratricopeptide repeat protein [Streptomyces sp. NBC_01803]|uniref:tetratricopeptide repeat protein n=1 Tax=Streptomyces sp. NBC_01803 TaxID=2975946 RepID=UPI002DDC7C3E|nr:tetratricopeptide repeat protein [Streptomyces sp. NBC_01803]WSA45927.1 tetratricopeptide repeat protein [Streptomyces sp. NBC_01803]
MTEASGAGAVAVGVHHGIVSTGDGATIHHRAVHLPGEAVRPPADVQAPPGLNNLPAPGSAVFLGREEDMARLAATLDDGPAASAVLHGLGGVGKSTLALQYAHLHRDRYNPIWWIPAETPDGIVLALADLAAHLHPYADLASAASTEGAAWATTWLRSHHGWLLVFDNAETPGDLAPVIGPLGTGRHLVTSRRSTGWHHLARPQRLATLAPDTAIDLLTRVSGGGDDETWAKLAAELGHLPLALEQAAAYIQHTVITPAAYLERLRRYPARMFAAAPDGQQRTVARVWQLSLSAVATRQPLALDILRTFAWLGPDDVPRDLAYALADDPVAVDEALAALHAYSLITLAPETFAIHRLVQGVVRDGPAEATAHARRQAIVLLGAALPGDPLFNVAGWPRWRALLPHVEALVGLLDPAEDGEWTEGILLAASTFLLQEGRPERATEFAERSAAASERLRGPDHPRTLASRGVLASAYRANGDLAAATPLHVGNLADCERVLGPDHPDTLASRGHLAHLHGLTGDLTRATELHERNLAAYERTLGPDHPHTLVCRSNLASTYHVAGDPAAAIPLHERNVTEYERVFGPDHPETITARGNLAYTYQLTGDLPRAIPLYELTLTARERVLGPAHPHTTLARDLLTNAREALRDG